MIPLQKVKDIIDKHKNLEKELSSSNLDPKLLAKKSKEYSNIGSIISVAKKYVNFENEKKLNSLVKSLKAKYKGLELNLINKQNII